MSEGNTIYTKAFGYSSLEYHIPNTIETTFNTGSLAKQVTAMAIVILEEEGKLSYDEEVQKYLPEFPRFDQPITIRHLLHHTSGLRSLHDLLALAGWRGDDFRTNDDLMRFIHLQRELNFPPGSQFSYSNTGYVVLARILENINGEAFDQWVRSRIFEPLGMENTTIEPNYQNVVPMRATSYYHSHDTVYERASPYWGYTGAGNMYTSVGDLLSWTRNFYDPQDGWAHRFQALTSLDPLLNGEPNLYGFGVFVDRQKGRDRIQHAGVIGGYRSFVAIYPKNHLNIVILSNFSNTRVGELSDAIAHILLTDRVEVRWTTRRNKRPEAREKDTVSLQAIETLAGTYYSPEVETFVSIRMQNGSISLYHPRHGTIPLRPTQNQTFKGDWPFQHIRFVQKNDSTEGLRISNGRVHNLWFRRVTLPPYQRSNLKE
ncbi:Beta-lactamase [Robiginitalea biformata HTCC2501]|uniref:Beta-lactamase n=2 Tax=Robiginitalea TaxID=252306 RepID=A4CMC9_ROBBH|nr:Beta-lactamase [Robiginitalea biformata HTCC2501]